MRCPTLAELPAPPIGLSGWPWSAETVPLPPAPRGASPWPRVTVITPSYNQGQFLEETIRSVLLQGYPDLEYLIFDGGSQDESMGIIRRYERFLSHWESEPDRGQSHAINKGFARATGEIVAWLNSDDTYLPGALTEVATFLAAHPDVDLVYGDCDYVDEAGVVIASFRVEDFDLRRFVHWRDFVAQPAALFRRAVLDKVGILDEGLRYAMDYDLWLRIAERSTPVHIPLPLATYRLSAGSKTASHPRSLFEGEEHRVAGKHGRSRLARFRYWLPTMLSYRCGLVVSSLARAVRSRHPRGVDNGRS